MKFVTDPFWARVSNNDRLLRLQDVLDCDSNEFPHGLGVTQIR
jgi:hypothetical protein